MNANGTRALMVRDNDLVISFIPEAVAMKEAALEVAALIGRVACAEEQQAAVDAQKKLHAFLKLVETSRLMLKQPLLEACRAVDEAPKQFRMEVAAEELRIVELIESFQALEMAKVRAAQAAENTRLTALERERSAALAAVVTHEEADRVQEEFNQRAASEAPEPITPVRAEGQIVKEDWDFEIRDVWALAKAHPECVKAPEPYRSKIKALLDAGIAVVGVKAWRTVNASVTTATKREKAITI